MLKCFFLVLGKLQCFHYDVIAFDELGGGKTNRDLSPLGMVLDEMHDAVQATVHRSAMIVFVAEILTHRRLLVLGDVQCVLH